MMTEMQCEPEQFTGRIVFMGKKETKKCVMRVPKKINRICEKIRARTLVVSCA